MRVGGYPAPFRRLLGIVVPEFWPHAAGETRQVTMDGTDYSCEVWSDWIELEGADAVAVFRDGWLSGRPAVTRNGSAWYVGTQLDAAGMEALVGKLADATGVAPPLEAPRSVEVVQREGEGWPFLFLLNHGAEEATVELAGRYRDLLGDVDCAGVVTLEPFGIAVLKAS